MQVLNERQAAQFLKVSVPTLASWRCRGKGPPYTTIESRIVYLEDELIKYLKSRMVFPSPKKKEYNAPLAHEGKHT